VCVLLVEDEIMIRDIMEESLLDAGYDVVSVANGLVAAELMRKPPRRFTALVTDFHMPGDMDGSQVAAMVRHSFPRIPVIIASGRPEVLNADWQTDHGYRLLKKPYLPSDLVKLLRLLADPARPPGQA